MKYKIILITLITVFILVGCKDKNTNEPTEITPFPFLKVGNQWEYEIQYFNNGEAGYKTTKIIKIDAVGFRTDTAGTIYDVYYSKKQDNEDGTYSFEKVYEFNRTDSSFIMYFLSKKGPLLHWNCYLGQRYNNNLLEITSLNSTIKVDSTTYYDCIETSEDDANDLVGKAYISKKYGLIFSTAKDAANPSTTREIKLKSKNF